MSYVSVSGLWSAWSKAGQQELGTTGIHLRKRLNGTLLNDALLLAT